MTDTGVAERDREVVLAELAQVSAELKDTLTSEARLYDQRLALMEEGRALAQPITQRQLAATAGVTEEAVIQALRKASLRRTHAAGEHAGRTVPKCPDCKAEARNGGG